MMLSIAAKCRSACRLLATTHVQKIVLTKYSTDPPPQITDAELQLAAKLKQKFPKATQVQVQDISGGCGSMYEVYIVAEEFIGKKTVMQHRMVNEALKEDIKNMHGLRISTEVPDAKS